ncbi:MAG: hypothetical protein KDC87_04475 [Planctomycetes bacterium]|nr:hypothetical protein [Planctomycetota bacterium]MCB9871368.1 hypothetical protein [Planctomycetota bacterium]MCB9888622.1 hypothetical protein [Planctomycetota bacterium]
MGVVAVVLGQLLFSLQPEQELLRFGIPLPDQHLAAGLRVARGRGSLQWRRLQARPDPHTGRTWVELCVRVPGARRGGPLLHVYAGGVGAVDPERGDVVRRTVEDRLAADGRVHEEVWRWCSGQLDRSCTTEFAARTDLGDGEAFLAGESLSSGGVPDRFLAAGIAPRTWRRVGLLPRGGTLAADLRQRLLRTATRLHEEQTRRGSGDYRRSKGVVTNLEFDTTLALARLGMATGDRVLLARAWRAARHSVDIDLDPNTGLHHRHGLDHHSGPADPGHTWLSGVLLVGCLAAEERWIAAAQRIARGLARHPPGGQGRDDRVRDVGWPLLEMETWLRFADDREVAAACAGLVGRLLRRWDDANGVFRFGEGIRSRSPVYEEPLWVTAGCLVPGLRAYELRTRDRRVAEVLAVLQRRVRQLVLNGKPGLPLRCWLRAGQIVGQARVGGTPSGYLLLEGLAPRDLSRCLRRGPVRSALGDVPGEDDVDLPTSFTMAARCWWIYR